MKATQTDIELTEEEIEALESVEGGEGLEDFIRRIAPHEPPPRHLAPLIEVLERARRERVRVCVSLPPRHAKSTTIRRAIAWWLTKFPRDTCAYTTYNDTKAESESRKIRAVARSAGVHVGAEGAADTLREWRTAEGGGLIAAGAGGGLTGEGVQGILIVDDPYKDPEQADSLSYRDGIREWFGEVAYTRLEGASVVVVHTRWREDDLIGWLVGEHGWECINLPAIAGHDDPLGRSEGDALWPERFSAEELESIRKVLGEFSFSALYQGQPRARGKRVFEMPPATYDPAIADFTGWSWVIGADPSASKKTSADYSAAVLQAFKRGATPDQNRSRIVNVFHKQMQIPDFARELLAWQRRYPTAKLAVEAVGAFAVVPQLIEEAAPGVKVVGLTGEDLGGDKFQRAQGFAAAWNDQRVEVPVGAPWLEGYLQELERFTGVSDQYDDQVDASSHGWNHMNRGVQPAAYKPPGAMPARRR